MSREGILPNLLQRDIHVSELVYSQVSVSVYRGTFHGSPCAVKILSLPDRCDYRELERECITMTSLSHPHLLHLYDCCWIQTPSKSYLLLVTEWCQKDLAKDLTYRRRQQYMWSNEQLLKLFYDIVSALVYMQNSGVAHRDLKPENIFLTTDGQAKIGDFGSAKWQAELLDFSTVRGTPLFLSPKLRYAMVKGETKVMHNIYKSDVFSLGLTMVAVMRMNFPVELASLSTTDEGIQEAIDALQYGEWWKEVLRNMMWIEEGRRWDFKQLWSYMNPSPAPEVMQTEVPRPKSPERSVPAIQDDGSNGQEELNLPSISLCLHCKSPVDKYSYYALCQVIQLYCNPEQHLFCSPSCFLSYAHSSIQPLTCPLCHTEIDLDTYLFYTQMAQRESNYIPQEHTFSCKNSVNSATQGSLNHALCGWGCRISSFFCLK